MFGEDILSGSSQQNILEKM